MKFSLPFIALIATLSLGKPITDSLQTPFNSPNHFVDLSIHAALASYDDPLDALLALRPGLATHLAEPRLLEIAGEQLWLTEGDKLRLRKEGKKFIDLTDVGKLVQNLIASKPHLPELTNQRHIKPLFPDVSTDKMRDVLKHMTSYYSRYYYSTFGEQSARWLHDHIAEIIANSPFQSYISLSYHTHKFPQPTIIARFEPPVLNASLTLTIIGAHQDSANYLFPLLPAPGADDDCSGTVSILEAFRVLAMRGFIPERGPVEFHWYAAEEAGLLGSMARAVYTKEQGTTVGAMLEFDMTAFIARNAKEETMGFVRTQADSALTDWCIKVAKEYISIPANVYDLGDKAGSDYMSWTKLGFPSAFATEGNPMTGGFPGEFDPYLHTSEDKMDIDNDQGVFSIEHMARFTEFAIAFVVEQAGWSLKHTRQEDNTKLLWS